MEEATDVNLISREELRRKLERGDEFKLVMTLSGFAYRTKHIPSSLHFETIAEAVAALDREDEIVVYCADLHCPASIYAYRLLEREGFTHVRRYAGGVADWEEAGYPLEGHPRDRARSRVRTPRNRSQPNRRRRVRA
jgi:rhodanese-related sulfurtransferase